MVKQDTKALGIRWDARMDITLIEELFKRRSDGEKLSLGKAFERNFLDGSSASDKRISKHIKTYKTALISELESDLFAQKTRHNKAKEALKTKVTKKAENDRDVSERQIARITKRLERLKDTKERDNDSRIYAFDYAPIIVSEKDTRIIKPMRYHLRPNFADESWDRKFGGCYNARRDKLTTSWKSQFGKNHAIMIITSFFENVALHDLEQRKLKKGEEEQNVVIEFSPKGMDYMIIPCIYDTWKAKDGTLLHSFALITDEPPAEVVAAGHDRCPIFLSEDRIEDWLNPKGKTQKELFEILDDRQTPFYEHALAG